MTIFWDFNGTLVDDVELTVRINDEVFLRHGYRKTSVEEYRRLFRFPVQAYYDALGVSAEDFPTIAREWGERYVACFDQVRLAPGVAETVKRFHQAGFRQVILSASQQDRLRAQVNGFPALRGMFDAVLGLADVYAAGKVTLALDYLRDSRIDPKDAAFIGDTCHDAEVARAIGCGCYLISGGHQSDEVLADAGAPVLKRLQDLPPLLGL